MPRIRKAEGGSKSPPAIWNIGMYIRLSKEDGNEESRSVTNQRKILDDYIAEAITDPYSVVAYYIDDGLTGTDDTRDGFARMIRDMEAGRINCIVCKTLSRAFRNYADQGRYLEEVFPKYGVRFISVGTPHVDSHTDSDSIQNGMEIPLNGMLNDRYAAKISADVRRTLDNKRARGEFIGAFAPYGYKKDPDDKNRLIVDEDAAPVVRSIFQWFVWEGYSKNGIVKKLNQSGEPNPETYKRRQGLRYQNPGAGANDGLWGFGTVSAILQNRVYTGAMVQGRNRIVSYKVHEQTRVPEDEWFVVPDRHEAVIDEETFFKAQTLHRKDTRTAPGERKLRLFSGLVRCYDCHKAMHRKTARNLAYFVCRTYREKSGCTKHSLREDALERAVLAALQAQIALADSLPEEIERVRAAPAVRREAAKMGGALRQAEKQLRQTQSASDSLYMDWKREDISKEEYHRFKERLAGQLRQTEQTIASLKAEMREASADGDSEDPYLTAFLTRGNIERLNRGLCVELLDTVWVHEGGEITMDVKFADPWLPARS